MRRLSVALAVILAGCGATTTQAPTERPTPTPAAARPIAERIATLKDGIHELYCDTEPISSFCSRLEKVDGDYWIEPLSENSVYIYSTMADSAKAREIAMVICKSVALSSHDPETGETLGIRHLRVWDKTGQIELADCNAEDA
jgi:hypothetical protein